MINSEAEKCVREARFSKHFSRPLYDSYCFSAVPGTVKKLFGLTGDFDVLPSQAFREGKYDLIILLFVDGFGWKFFEEEVEKTPFLKRFKEEGIVSRMTAQFPSTTAAHVTCLSTGLEVGQSGVYEWFYYEPKVDRVIAPLLFSFAGEGGYETLQKAITPTEIYPTRTVFLDLHEAGVRSFVMQDLAIAHSTYSQVMFSGAKLLPYQGIEQALKNLLEISEEVNDVPHYVYLYFDDIDSVGHRHGIGSLEWKNTQKAFWETLERTFAHIFSKRKKTACMLIADHGMVPVDPKSTLYLNQQFPELEPQFLKKNRKGQAIVPAGSCRDFFLHVQEEALGEVQELLKTQLAGKAEIYRTQELIQEGLFGKRPPSQAFLNRVGNLVILPYAGEAVWWYKKGHFEQHFYAAHGGLTREEIEIPFLFLNS